MSRQTRRDIAFGLAVLIVTAFAVTGFVNMCWWLICLIGETLP
jgi:hypothetical protein